MKNAQLTKVCTRCGIEKLTNQFHRNITRHDGLAQYCKDCARETGRIRRNNRNAVEPPCQKCCPSCNRTLPSNCFWKNKNSNDGLQVYCIDCLKQQRQSNSYKEHIREYMREYRQKPENKRRIKDWTRNYRKEYRQRPYVKAQIREYIKTPKAKALRNKHVQRYAAKRHNAPGDHSVAEWQHMISFTNERCVRCGKKAKLTKDHVIPLTLGGCNCIHNLQPLCVKCNSLKNNHTFADYRSKEMHQWLAELPHNH